VLKNAYYCILEKYENELERVMTQNTGRDVTKAVIWGTAILLFFSAPVLGFLLIGSLISWSLRRFWRKVALAWLIFLGVLLLGYQLRVLVLFPFHLF
jgi:hypothetical protein